MLLETEDNSYTESELCALERAHHPVLRLSLNDSLDLGGEFVRWEIATAVCGAVMGINPFDEPNVTESKQNTARLLKQFEAAGRLPEVGAGLPQELHRLLGQARPGDYLALLAFLNPSPEHAALLGAIRRCLRDRTRLATTLGFGPRYLHSTGQLHKGGPNSGLFLLLTGDDTQDLPVPGQPYTFGVLKRAQALGDLEALEQRGRRVLHLHLGRDAGAGLEQLFEVLAATPSAAAD